LEFRYGNFETKYEARPERANAGKLTMGTNNKNLRT
jgi:hypothetical protein